MAPSLTEIIETLTDLPTWEDKYEYLISLGKALPAMPEALKTHTALVKGCTSQVWLVAGWSEQGTLNLHLDSDAIIVKGLLAIVHSAYANQTKAHIQTLTLTEALTSTGLLQHLSPNRRNGFASVLQHLQVLASASV